MALMTTKDLQRIMESQDVQEVATALIGYLTIEADPEKDRAILDSVLLSLDNRQVVLAFVLWDDLLFGVGFRPVSSFLFEKTRRVSIVGKNALKVDFNGEITFGGGR